MEFFAPEWWTALFIIIGTDLILAGDNAVVIALAARRLPQKQQKKAILWGTVGAVAIRAVATLAVVWLLEIPGLHLVGGLLLVWIAYKLLVDNSDYDDIKAGVSFGEAIRTIIIADALMGLDNVLAIAGASHGSYLLVVIGLLVSVPIIMFGSTLFIKLIERFSWIVYIGAGLLAYVSASMIVGEPFMESFFTEYPIVKWALIIIVIAGVMIAGKMVNDHKEKSNDEDEEGNKESSEEYDSNKQNA